jgi:6-phosphogluconolactonase (cycloisomerase 2 family)
MEIKQRMSKRFGWLLGVVGLVLIGLLVACGSSYNASQDGLLLVGSQGSGLIETFGFNLNGGSVTWIQNTPGNTSNETCVLNGIPSSIVIDPAGAYAYTILNQNPACTGSLTGIQAFKINSDGTTTSVGSLVNDPSPVSLVMDAAGKFLFVNEGTSINVYAIGSGATLTLVPGNYNFINGSGFLPPYFAAIAATPTVFPAIGLNGVQNSVCSTPGLPTPTSEYLYAVDSINYVVWEFSVDMTTGALGNPPNTSQVPSFPTGSTPLGVAVDPCNRFVYVTDSLTDKVSAYTMCNGSVTQATTCLQPPDGSLVPVTGSPFSLAGSPINPGPLVVDPYGNYVYVLGTGSNTINLLKISPVSGALATLSPATVATGRGPVQIVIRGDDNWLFVSNYGTGAAGGTSVSEYSVTPESGALTALPAIQTDNYPWGLAVK